MSGHKPRKRFGQHFLQDEAVIQAIISALRLQPDACVCELGPGTGALTQALLAEVEHVHAVELDRDLAGGLAQRCGVDATRLTVYQADMLTFSIARCLPEGVSACRVVGNLPYNISTPLLFHLLTQRPWLVDMHFMLQKEVVQRLCAPVGSRHYGRLSVMLQACCDFEWLFDVPPSAFLPPPKVMSSVVRCCWHQRYAAQTELEQSWFAALVKTAFSGRRKQVQNTLSAWLEAADFQACAVDGQSRPQALSVADFMRLSSWVAARAATVLG